MRGTGESRYLWCYSLRLWSRRSNKYGHLTKFSIKYFNISYGSLDIASFSDSSLCGSQVKITNTNNGPTVIVTISDTCVTCLNENSLDLSEGAFLHLSPTLDTGILPSVYSIYSWEHRLTYQWQFPGPRLRNKGTSHSSLSFLLYVYTLFFSLVSFFSSIFLVQA